MSGAARGTEGAVDERGNPFWTYDSPTGPLEITINLAKPEKDPRDIAAADRSDVASCDLCWGAAGEDGPAHLRRSGAPVTEVELGGEPWAWWFSPYGYFPEHLIVASREHRPMAVGHGTIARLLDF